MRKRTTLALLGAVLVAVLVVGATTGCGSKKSSETIVFCSDTTYPPMESIVKGEAAGADIDIAKAIVKLWGKKVEIKTTSFDGIIPALQAKKCDAIISALTNTPERAKAVDFADYVTVGTLMMVQKGNPANVSDMASLSGKTVAVQASTTQKDMIDAENEKLADQGKPKITLKIFPADTNAQTALQAGKVDAYLADATPVLFYMKKSPGQFEVVGDQLDASPEGIATRKGDPLGAKFKAAIDQLYANGEMQKILAEWGISQFALK